MPCKACRDAKKRRQQRLESRRKHDAERRARGETAVQIIKPKASLTAADSGEQLNHRAPSN